MSSTGVGAGLLCEGVLGTPPQAICRVHGVAQEGGRAVGDAEGTPRAGHVMPQNDMRHNCQPPEIVAVTAVCVYLGTGHHARLNTG